MKIETLIIGAAVGFFLAKTLNKSNENNGLAPQLPFGSQDPQRRINGLTYFKKNKSMVAGCNCANGSRLFKNYVGSDYQRMAFLTA